MPNELTNPNNVVTEERLAQFYQQILPYLGGMPDILANKFSKADLYSTDEKLIGRWIDGKPLYQRAITGLSFIGSSASGSWHYITDSQTDFELNGNVDIIVDGVALRTNDSLVFRGCAFRYNKTSSRLEYCSNIAFSGCNILILQYTKTTDSAVEIGDDTDYSTTEKIVGTWIDGKPIWQKTWSVVKTVSSGASTTLFTLSGVDTSIMVSSFVIENNNKFMLPDSNCRIKIDSSGNVIANTSSGSSFSNATWYITLQYTKTSS